MYQNCKATTCNDLDNDQSDQQSNISNENLKAEKLEFCLNFLYVQELKMLPKINPAETIPSAGFLGFGFIFTACI